MCGGEPRAMLRKDRGKADGPIYSIQICIPKHGTHVTLLVLLFHIKPFYCFLVKFWFFLPCISALNLIFSFTNGVDWDGPYRLQFQVPKQWRNKTIDFFNEVELDRFSESIILQNVRILSWIWIYLCKRVIGEAVLSKVCLACLHLIDKCKWANLGTKNVKKSKEGYVWAHVGNDLELHVICILW